MKTISTLFLSLSLLCSACEAKQNNSTLPSTAQANVSILADKLAMPGLNRSRQIRLYLPPNYAQSDKSYPVLYMHDAQNLFDVKTSYAGEWGVDETMNALAAAGKLELIVVGIDNGESKRMNELNPWANPEFSPAEGKQYVEFIVNVVKPYIDQHYRSKPDRANTAIMGSSMGGLISHYAINQFPQVFSKAGIYSPSYWISKESIEFIAKQPAPKDARLYIASGEKEGGSQVSDTKKSYDELIRINHPRENLSLKIVAGAEHNEKFWREDFEKAVLWLFTAPTKE
jgi:predicted alpha/beta superfamily hydrolase